MHTFWRMVVQENVKLIVTLCQSIGGENADAHLYFPKNKGEKLKLDGGLEVETIQVAETEHVIKRKFKVHVPGQKEHCLVHNHFRSWKDW